MLPEGSRLQPINSRSISPINHASLRSHWLFWENCDETFQFASCWWSLRDSVFFGCSTTKIGMVNVYWYQTGEAYFRSDSAHEKAVVIFNLRVTWSTFQLVCPRAGQLHILSCDFRPSWKVNNSFTASMGPVPAYVRARQSTRLIQMMVLVVNG
jgi:hypothetical protein